MKHLIIRVYGRVQGVGFRYFSRRRAMAIGIFGFVHNEPDGTVYIEAEGKEEDLRKFLEWCKRGSFLAKVDKIDFEFSNYLKGFSRFEIKW